VRLTVAEAASLLGREEERVYDWIEDDALPAQRLGGQYRINRTELLEWATERGLALAPRVFANRGAGIETLAGALRAGEIHYDVAGDDAAAVVGNLIDALPLRDAGDRETLRHFVLARPGFGLQLIAAGIAVPQVRTPAVVGDAAAVTLAFPAKPLSLSCSAGFQPAPPSPPRAQAGSLRYTEQIVGALFLVVSPTVHAHLMMLSQLTACLGDHLFVDAVVRRLSADEILAAAAAAEERL